MKLPLLALSVMLGACAAPTADVGASQEAIAGGTRETGHPEVVFMYRQDGAACTGAIIAPRVVLIANHCVGLMESGGPAAPASYFRIYVGSSVAAFTAEYRVSEVLQVPNAGLGPSGAEANDVALLILSSSADVTPMGLGRASPTTLWGQSVTAIGYGQTPTSQMGGTKYRVTTTIDGFQNGFIFVRPSVCPGDSGGPLVGPDGLTYGVASFIYSPDGMTQPTCGTAPGAYNELYRHLDFIDGVLEEFGTCIPDPETCNGEDDNCDGVVDEGCTPLGQPCTASDTCVGGLCADTAAGKICTATCDPLRPSLGCSAGFYCSGGGGCDGHCVPGAAGSLPHGADCTANTDCLSLFCDDPGDHHQRCLEPCRGDAGLCLAGEVCAAGPGACGGCVPSAIDIGERGLGEPCEDDGDCRGDMVCHAYAGVSECASACDGGACPEGFECRDALCIRDRRQGVGGVCVDNADCGGALCAVQGDRRWCTATCSSAADCPSGFDCLPADGTNVCAPVTGLEGEPCTANGDCASGLCAFTSRSSGVCSVQCDGHDACAPGFECQRTGDGTASVCIPAVRESTGGGCSVGQRRGGGLALAMTSLLVALAAYRRRRA